MPRYIIAACIAAPLIRDPDFPVCVAWFDQPTKLEALREANEYFADWAKEPVMLDETADKLTAAHRYTHLRVVDGPRRGNKPLADDGVPDIITGEGEPAVTEEEIRRSCGRCGGTRFRRGSGGITFCDKCREPYAAPVITDAEILAHTEQWLAEEAEREREAAIAREESRIEDGQLRWSEGR